MKLIRIIVGKLLVFLNFLTFPAQGSRPEDKQREIEQELKALCIYEFHFCPFCIKLRRSLRRLNLPISLRDAKNDQQFRAELLKFGGKIQVPCMRIEDTDGNVKWMYESSDISTYLERTYPL
jgi:glutaredoxin